MSIEAALAGLTEATTKNTETALALIAALKVTNEYQERLVAGQAAAIEKVEAPKRTRGAAKAAEPAKTEEPAQEPAQETTGVSDDDLRDLAGTYLGGKNEKTPLTAEQVTERRGFIAAMMKELGTAKLCGPESTLDDDGRKKAAFYIRRASEGLKVDFSADYDFDGDPTQGGAVEEEEDLGI